MQTLDHIDERHRHRYEVNPDLIGQIEAAGLQFVGKDETGQVRATHRDDSEVRLRGSLRAGAYSVLILREILLPHRLRSGRTGWHEDGAATPSVFAAARSMPAGSGGGGLQRSAIRATDGAIEAHWCYGLR